MSLFDKLFNGDKPQDLPIEFWNRLETMAELDALEKESFTKPIAIFKHSTGCGISRMAWNQFKKQYKIEIDDMELYYLDLLAFREISNEIAKRFGVIHQSPQVIVIKDGKAIHDTSHERIDAANLEQFL